MKEKHMNTNYRFLFLRANFFKRTKQIGCVVFSHDETEGLVQFQVSVAHPNDDFNKGHARQLALGRLIETPLSTYVPTSSSIHEVTRIVMKSLSRDDFVPSRARRSAVAWLKYIEGSIIDP